jgi:hypothetical protein
MNTATAITALVNLATAAVEISVAAQTVAQLIRKAQMEGRDTFTAEEWKVIESLDDGARARLEDSIRKAETAAAGG